MKSWVILGCAVLSIILASTSVQAKKTGKQEMHGHDNIKLFPLGDTDFHDIARTGAITFSEAEPVLIKHPFSDIPYFFK